MSLARRMTGAELIAAERQRQQTELEYSVAMDATMPIDDLAKAALCYLEAALGVVRQDPPPMWPWARTEWKRKDRRANLLRAGALLAAAIDADMHREGSER